MPRLPGLLGIGVILAGCGGAAARRRDDIPAPAVEAAPSIIAVATLIDSSGAQVGVATVSDSSGMAHFGISIAGLATGPHGMHLHAQGTCTPPGFESAGPHFNPDGRKHGSRNPQGAHTGDLPNLQAGSDGTADTTVSVPTALARSGPRFILQPHGTSIVVHAGADDLLTDPGGNSGVRVACGVFTAP